MLTKVKAQANKHSQNLLKIDKSTKSSKRLRNIANLSANKKVSNQFKKQIYFFYKIIFLFSLIFIFHFLTFSFLQNFIKTKKNEARQFLHNHQIDQVVIFTGDIGRIKFGLDLAEQYDIPNILITGVYKGNTTKKLLQLLPNKDQYNQKQLKQRIRLDYKAKNTYENILNTFNEISPHVKKILIISHNYHLPRIIFMMNMMMVLKKRDVYYYGPYSKEKPLKRLTLYSKEVLKIINFLYTFYT